MDRRFICPECRTKWFSPDEQDAPAPCARCGAELEPYDEAPHDLRAYGDVERPPAR
jgi:DNA-directed RNA polymerase subunit RPC12/RpoP